MIKFYNRKEKRYEIEKVAAGKFINYLYTNALGKSFLEIIFKRKFLTFLYGKYCDSFLSKKRIKPFIEEFGMDMSEYERHADDYNSFNDFFHRKLKPDFREIAMDANTLISPCDGKLTAIDKINEDTTFKVKGFTYSVKDLLKDEKLAKEYKNGYCLIFRLCPTDYHRFHFIDNGTCSPGKSISGHYYSVNPVALENVNRVFSENKREYSILHSENFDDVIYLEVGATFVGSIIQTYNPNARIQKGEEKGYFKFGGSTVILFLKENMVKLDKDLLSNSRNGMESLVRFGEKIGVKA
ncbi:phosphatidylserine decarboxylase [Clostridium sp. UBA4548]|uniref:phosphatidylserine decarboxylase n=1 Tax=Clostridium sp. UBA4548 TaxID=1946361 RepID=UPI0025C115FE|nr:phosphatidylserine decarboxylase [Clostridium sp. UBA4548]